MDIWDVRERPPDELQEVVRDMLAAAKVTEEGVVRDERGPRGGRGGGALIPLLKVLNDRIMDQPMFSQGGLSR